MEGYKLNLRNLCRTYGSKIDLKYGYKTAKTVEEYSYVLYQFYVIDIDMEIDERYPKCLCGNCKRKLDRLKIQESKAGLSKDYKAVAVLPHLVENCMVCLEKKKNPGILDKKESWKWNHCNASLKFGQNDDISWLPGAAK